MFFLKHIYEIYTVSHAQGVGVGTAYDMFRADVCYGSTRDCRSLKHVNFKKMKHDWDGLPPPDKVRAYDEWHKFISEHAADADLAFAAGRAQIEQLANEFAERRNYD